jgi:hypothetical protein
VLQLLPLHLPNASPKTLPPFSADVFLTVAERVKRDEELGLGPLGGAVQATLRLVLLLSLVRERMDPFFRFLLPRRLVPAFLLTTSLSSSSSSCWPGGDASCGGCSRPPLAAATARDKRWLWRAPARTTNDGGGGGGGTSGTRARASTPDAPRRRRRLQECGGLSCTPTLRTLHFPRQWHNVTYSPSAVPFELYRHRTHALPPLSFPPPLSLDFLQEPLVRSRRL